MPSAMNPIIRMWKPKAVGVSAKDKYDIYGNDLSEPGVQERYSDLIWSTYDALQRADAERSISEKDNELPILN